ncbi:hypothetical protein PR003_g4784 [Phytophthora rubi]|uniref:Uncharacterized protein n=1 Tax=Phytophthora rubi TaxID=129364 RepID=A0A6A4FUV4_9STRA|nr:hypothetical protein PF003_g37657 [Phytophthora fragariae]KAE9040858.1 hypothetical protein PR002_g4736 [Phytophthora rubi]KAE9351653.1 hypothetical protein PR003_g4784 [Phytophthora rubi]
MMTMETQPEEVKTTTPAASGEWKKSFNELEKEGIELSIKR